MNEELAKIYGTDKTAAEHQALLQVSKDNFLKVAAAGGYDFNTASPEQTGHLFSAWQTYEKLAAEQGADLSQYSAAQVNDAFNRWYDAEYGSQKQASGEDYTLAMAESFISKLAGEATIEEQTLKLASFLGQATAHALHASFAGEFDKEAKRRLRGAGAAHMSAPPPATGIGSHTSGDYPEGGIRPGESHGSHRVNVPKEHLREIPDTAAHAGADSNTARTGLPLSDKAKYKADEVVEGVKDTARNARKSVSDTAESAVSKAKELWASPNRNRNLAIAGGIAGAAGLAYGGKKLYDHYKDKDEKRAFDITAARHAQALLMDYGVSAKEAAERLNVVLDREAFAPVSDDVKIASTESAQLSVQTRAVELLEAAGYELALGTMLPPGSTPSSMGNLAAPAKLKPPTTTPKLPGMSAATTPGGSSSSQVVNNPQPAPAIPPAPIGGGAPKTAFHRTSPMNVQQMIQHALSASIPSEKIAAEACDEPESKKDKDSEKKKKDADKRDETKEACDRAFRLRDINIKVASELKGAVPTSDVNTTPATTYPEHFGQGRQQVKSPKGLPGGADLATSDVSESAKAAGLWLNEMGKRANATAASLPTRDVTQSGGAPGIPSSGPAVIGSNQGLISMTPAAARDASNKRQDLAQHFDEPALTQSTDTTLKELFEHTEGNKLATTRDLFARLNAEVRR